MHGTQRAWRASAGQPVLFDIEMTKYVSQARRILSTQQLNFVGEMGMMIHDSWHKISKEIASGIIEVMSNEQALKLLNATPKTNPKAPESGGHRPSTGIVELD